MKQCTQTDTKINQRASTICIAKWEKRLLFFEAKEKSDFFLLLVDQ